MTKNIKTKRIATKIQKAIVKEKAKMHSFFFDEDNLAGHKVDAVYLPSDVCELITSAANGYKYNVPFSLEMFRRICLHLFPGVINMQINWEAVNQEHPWLILAYVEDEEEQQEVIQDVLYMLEAWINGFPNRSISLQGQRVRIESIDLADILDTDLFDRIIPSYFGEDFINKYADWSLVNLLVVGYERLDKKKNVQKREFQNPPSWMRTFDGERFTLVSQPFKVKLTKQGGSKTKEYCYSYRISFQVDRSFEKKRLNLYIGITRWLQGPIKSDSMEFLFHKNETGKYKERTMYLLTDKRGKTHMLTVPIRYYEDIDKPGFSFDKTTRAFLSKFGVQFPPVTKLFQNPKDFQVSNHYQEDKRINMVDSGAFIPYMLEDFGGEDDLNSGIHFNEHKHIFSIIEQLSSFDVVPLHDDIIKVKHNAMAGGKVFLDTRKNVLDNHVHFEVLTDKGELLMAITTEQVMKMFELKEGSMPSRFEGQGKDKSSVNRYELLSHSKNKNALTFTLEDREHKVKLILTFSFINEPRLTRKLEETKGEFKRIVDIKKTFSRPDKPTYTIVDMDMMYGKTDPKRAVQLGLLETGRLSKNIITSEYTYAIERIHHYNEILLKSNLMAEEKLEAERKLIHWEKQKDKVIGNLGDKLRVSIYDLLSRDNYYNQMVHAYANNSNDRVYYFPTYFKTKDGHIYLMARMRNGKVDVCYQDGKWLCFKDSLLALNETTKKTFTVRSLDGLEMFVKKHVQMNGIVLFPPKLKDTYHTLRNTYEEGKLNFLVGYIDSTKEHNPFIYKEKMDLPIFSSDFITKDEHVYFSVPPKPGSHQILMYENKQYVNYPYMSRIPMKIELCKDDIEIVMDIHRMRNIGLTYSSYTSYPIPLHQLNKYHGKLIEQWQWL